MGHAVAQMVDALCNKPEGRRSNPNEITGFLMYLIHPGRSIVLVIKRGRRVGKAT
jgi:hypothetical protein